MATTVAFHRLGQKAGIILSLAALFSSGCLYSKQLLDEARQDGYEEGFRAGFARTRSVTVEVAGYGNCEEGEDQVYINESCEIDVTGQDAEGACEW
jgi:hypothetical protein